MLLMLDHVTHVIDLLAAFLAPLRLMYNIHMYINSTNIRSNVIIFNPIL